ATGPGGTAGAAFLRVTGATPDNGGATWDFLLLRTGAWPSASCDFSSSNVGSRTTRGEVRPGSLGQVPKT
ncbi:hypothetical protein ABZT51_29070, partial [Streptomyces sp. NPDC005373]|uniref:hypothetical protein n=1 Tax=Streptomyces sp. NPDC005373 TaxID=3156879 RepID=UPI0033AFD219